MRIDLRKIRSSIVCFCSWGDDITPPPQALGWSTDLYKDDQDILANGQTIVYAVHDRIGHLGIFVSASVARKEHDEFASNIDLSDVLPPGLYEAVLSPKDADAVNPDLVEGEWITRLKTRKLADVRAIDQHDPEDERRFAAVRRLSEINLGLYRTFAQPLVRSFANEAAADWSDRLQRSELPYRLFSNQNPLMQPVPQLAEQVGEQRRPAAPGNPFLALQEQVSRQIIATLDAWRDMWNNSIEQWFHAYFGSPPVQALAGLRASEAPPRRHSGVEPEELAYIEQQIAALKTRIPEGGEREAAIRSLIYVGLAEGLRPDERTLAVLQQIRADRGGGLSLQEFKQLLRDQYFMLLLDEEKALEAIRRTLPKDSGARKAALEAVRPAVSTIGTPTGARAERLRHVEQLFDVSAVSVARRMDRRSAEASAPSLVRHINVLQLKRQDTESQTSWR